MFVLFMKATVSSYAINKFVSDINCVVCLANQRDANVTVIIVIRS